MKNNNKEQDAPKQKISKKAYLIMEEGIVYLFQFGIITEAKHFKLLDKLNDTHHVV